jgi:hypothetical protein
MTRSKRTRTASPNKRKKRQQTPEVSAPSPPPESPPVAVVAPAVDPKISAIVMRNVVQDIVQLNTVDNTLLAFDPKVEEFKQFCDYVYSSLKDQGQRHLVESEKVEAFILYQAFREKFSTGGKKNLKDAFNVAAYTAYKSNYDKYRCGELKVFPEPKCPLGHSQINTYKYAILKLHRQQVNNKCNAYPWDHVWVQSIEDIKTLVKKRRDRIAKTNYQEKVDHEITPYQGVTEIPRMEQLMFDKGADCIRSAHAWSRHRFIFLATTCGILRYESLDKAELSDTLTVEVQNASDPHPLTIAIMQIATGKSKSP